MKWNRKLMQFIYSIYAFFLFILFTILALPFVLVSLLFGKIRSGNIIYKICRIWAYSWYALIGIKHEEIYESSHNRNKQYIFVGNHCSYIDIPAIVLMAHQPIRALGKYEMVKIPIFGFIYRAAVILVDRSNPEARAKSVRAMKAALNKNISIFIFPEGTFNETEYPLKSFYDGAFRIAIETQTPIKPVLLIDTLDRLHFSSLFSLSPGKNRVVYLEEVSVNGMDKLDIPILRDKVFRQMEIGLKRYRSYPVQ